MSRTDQRTSGEVESCFIPAGSQSGDQRVGQTTLEDTWKHTLRRAQLQTHTHTHNKTGLKYELHVAFWLKTATKCKQLPTEKMFLYPGHAVICPSVHLSITSSHLQTASLSKHLQDALLEKLDL